MGPSGAANARRRPQIELAEREHLSRCQQHVVAAEVNALRILWPAPQAETERLRQRPTEAAKQTAHYSGKKKAHTDKNVLLINEYTSKVVYLSPTVAGKTHDKRAADEADLVYPVNSTLDKDTGLQGYEPAGVLTQQPKKSLAGKS